MKVFMKANYKGKLTVISLLIVFSVIFSYFLKLFLLSFESKSIISVVSGAFLVSIFGFFLWKIVRQSMLIFSTITVYPKSIKISWYSYSKTLADIDVKQIILAKYGRHNTLSFNLKNGETVIFNDKIWINFAEFAHSIQIDSAFSKLIQE
jgi:hypothetical protein